MFVAGFKRLEGVVGNPWASLHPQLRQGWFPSLAPAPHARPVTPGRHGHVELAADLTEPHAGDSVALGHGQRGL